MLSKVGYEFDFLREAKAMERIRQSFCTNNKKSPVVVPRVMPGMVSRYYVKTAVKHQIWLILYILQVLMYLDMGSLTPVHK